MIKVLQILLVLSFLVHTKALRASETCPSLNTPKDLLSCAMNNHPDLIRGKGSLKQAESFEDKAGQRINPEFSVKSVSGMNLGDIVVNNEFNLTHTLELGGKRSARIEKGAADLEQVSSEFLKTKEDVYISVLRALYRIRQVHFETKTLEEALNTFSKIQRQYKSRPRLAPEQEVSLSVFQLAEGDYKLRKTSLETEEYSLERSIEIAIGKDFPHKESVLPPRKHDWPDYSAQGREFRGSDLKLALSDLRSAQAEMELARSESWPDLKIGPTIQSQTEGPIIYWTYGVNLTLPLPLFQINGAGRAVATTGLLRAEQSLELKKRELTQVQKVLVTQYERAVKSLKESVSLSEIERQHKAVEQQFARGVISSSLVIEAHRQMVDFTERQNDQELTALEALLRLRALEGSLFEGDL